MRAEEKGEGRREEEGKVSSSFEGNEGNEPLKKPSDEDPPEGPS